MTRQATALLLLAAAVAGLAGLFLVSGSDQPDGADLLAGAGGSVTRTAEPEVEAELSDLQARPAEGTREAALARATREEAGVRNRVRQRRGAVALDGPYRGRLLDPLGRPLSGVQVELMPWEQANTIAVRSFGTPRQLRLKATTDEEGRFAAEDSEPLGLTIGVKADARGYLDAPIKHIFQGDSTTNLGDIIVDGAVVIEGWVRDDLGRPIEGARVRRIEREGDQMIATMDQIGFSSILGLETTDADGRFKLEHEPEGEIVLLAEHDSIMPARFEGAAKRAGDVLVNIEITAERAGVIRGVVSGYPPGREYGKVAASALDPKESDGDSRFQTLMAARLSPAGEETAEIKGDGSFEIGGLEPGARYRIQAMERRQFVETVILSNSVDATADGSFHSLNFDPGATLELKVIDRLSREPVEEVTVLARWGERSAKVMLTPKGGRPPKRIKNGRLTLYELRPDGDRGDLTVTVDAPGYKRGVTAPITIAEGALASGGTLELERTRSLKFEVVEAITGKPVRKARVTLSTRQNATRRDRMLGNSGQEVWAKTDRAGRCQLSDLGDPEARLEVKARGYGAYLEDPIAPRPGKEPIRIVLSRGAELTVAVVGDEDLLLPGARVECRNLDEDRPWKAGKASGKDGLAVFDGLPAGTYEVRAMRSAGQPFGRQASLGDEQSEWQSVDLAANTKVRIDYLLPTSATLSGVVLIDGKPAMGARLSVVPADQADRQEQFINIQDQFAGFGNQPSTDTSDGEGRFEVADLGTGPAAALIRHEDLTMPARVDLEIEPGVNTVTFDLAISCIEGRAVDANGEAVTGASVEIRRSVGDESARISRQFLGITETNQRTAKDGSFRIKGVKPESKLQLVLKAKGFTDRVLKDLSVEPGRTLDVGAVELSEGGSALIVLADNGDSEGVTWVTLKPAEQESRDQSKIELLRAGRARVGGLAAGKWTVTVEASDPENGTQRRAGEPVEFEVRPGEESEVEVELPR
jgi:hypothetical protein